MRNCKAPSNVFVLNCSKDFCQQRNEALGKDHCNYINSGVLSQKIKEYNNSSKDLVAYLKKNTNTTIIDAEQNLEKTLADTYRVLEPQIIHVRPGAASNDLKKEITEKLVTNHNYSNLDVNGLIRDENERKTSIGHEIH